MKWRHIVTIVSAAVSIVFFLNACGDANLKKAKRLHNERNYEEAIQFYKLSLENDPENRMARYGLIEAYAQQLTDRSPEEITPEKVEKAMAELEPIAQPLMDDPTIRRYVSVIYQNVAKRYADEGRDDKAVELWTRIVDIEPSFAEAHFNLGVALVKTGKHEESLAHFEKTVKLNPYFYKGYYALGNSLLHLERYEEAANQYLKALELNPDDASIHSNLGLAYAALGEQEKALEEYRKAIELDPGHVYAYIGLRREYEKMGQPEKAQEVADEWKEYTETVLKARQEAEAGDASPEAASPTKGVSSP